MHNIVKNFNIPSGVVKITEIKTGIINKTYKVILQNNGNNKNYILQKINNCVFKNPEIMMDNVCSIIDYLKKYNYPLSYIKTKDNINYFIDETGTYWRLYNFIEDSESIDATKNLLLVRETGEAFGEFIYNLKDFPVSKLNDTIENFHNTVLRYEKLEYLRNFSNSRFKRIQTEWDFLFAVKKQACLLQLMENANLIFKRVVHNDTKCSNVLFSSETSKPIAVIDLDTVMPGLIAHDFGDGARSICSSLNEESNNFKNIVFDLEKFRYFSEGFIKKIKPILTYNEIKSLSYGIIAITAELAVRFLTDYLEGDVYFKISYEDNNLIRCKNQVALLKDIFLKQVEIQNIISENFFNA